MCPKHTVKHVCDYSRADSSGTKMGLVLDPVSAPASTVSSHRAAHGVGEGSKSGMEVGRGSFWVGKGRIGGGLCLGEVGLVGAAYAVY